MSYQGDYYNEREARIGEQELFTISEDLKYPSLYYPRSFRWQRRTHLDRIFFNTINEVYYKWGCTMTVHVQRNSWYFNMSKKFILWLSVSGVGIPIRAMFSYHHSLNPAKVQAPLTCQVGTGKPN